MKKLFIGKLSYSTSEDSLRNAFAAFEPLNSLKIITDKMSGQSRGFGFIEIEDSKVADEAIAALNGSSLDGRTIDVNEARPPSNNPRGFESSRSGYGNSSRSRNDNNRSYNNDRY